MKTFRGFTRHKNLDVLLVWLFLGLVFFTDFLTPLGFAHGILYVPVVIYAVLLPEVGERFRRAVVIFALLGTALYYVIAPNLSGLPEIYLISNRLLSAAILLLTYAYFRKMHALNRQYIEINKLEQSQRQTLDDFIDAMPVQVWLADARGTVDFVSSSLVEFTGKNR